MPVFVQVDVRSVALGRTRLRGLAEAVLKLLGEASSDLSVSFVGDLRMRRLNRRFRRKDRSTDVLAFAFREGRAPHNFHGRASHLGDVVIALPTAERQAKAANRALEEEIMALLIHGVLHLCGYDHERGRAEAVRMQRKERLVRRRLGRIPPFVRPGHNVVLQRRKGG